MNSRDLIIYIAQSPDIETERDTLSPQEVLIVLDGKEYPIKEVWVRGDNKLIIEANNIKQDNNRERYES